MNDTSILHPVTILSGDADMTEDEFRTRFAATLAALAWNEAALPRDLREMAGRLAEFLGAHDFSGDADDVSLLGTFGTVF